MTNKRSAAMAFASLLIESIAFSPPSTPTHLHRPTAALRVSQSTNSNPANAKTAEDTPWWQHFQLNDADLPKSVLSDFPILTHTSFDADGQLTTSTTSAAASSPTKRLIYLDSAATSQKPTQVTTALNNYYLRSNSNVHRGAHALSRQATSLYEEARDKVSDFIHANHRNEIIFTSGATEAINLVASSLSSPVEYCEKNSWMCLQKGDEIIISESEHHSNIVPWQIAAKKTGAILKYVPIQRDGENAGTFDIESFSKMLSSKTKVVSIQHVSNVLGHINPIHEICQLVREKSKALILLDACQSVPHTAVDVQSLQVDFIAASGHKMCGPTGIGFLWGKESILNQMAPYRSGGEMIDEVYMTHSTYADAPSRFEGGTPPIAQAVGLGAAIDYLNGLGMERIHEYELELGRYLHKRLEEIEGVTVLGPPVGVDRAALCAFVCEGVHPSDLSTFLDGEGVAIRAGHHCCQPLHRALGYSHSARASLYFYNTKEDVDEFVGALEETLKFFRSLDGDKEEEGGDEDHGFVPLF